MIKVSYDGNKKAWQWYIDYTAGRIKRKIAKKKNANSNTAPFPTGYIEKLLCALPDDVEKLGDLLIMPTDELRKKYPFIDRYCRLAKSHNGQMLIERINDKIRSFFDYSGMDKEIRWKIAEQMDISVCPYCNRQYIHPVKNAGYLGDLDHILDKDTHPLFALSVANMLPCCKPCNQKFKHTSQAEILSPRKDGFNDDCILRIRANDTAAILGEGENFDIEWKISNGAPAKKKDLLAENIEIFKLNEQYEFHKEDIKNLLRLKRIYNKSRRVELAALLRLHNDGEINRLIYKCSLQPEKFKDEPLSKMTYDIIVNNWCGANNYD